MALGLKDTQANVEAGLNTFTYTVPAAGVYQFSCESFVVPPSGLSIVINQNGTPIATSATPSASQNFIAIAAVNVQCAINDVITIVLTSSVPLDAMLQNVKSIINIVAQTY
jgi:hypothetical protein